MSSINSSNASRFVTKHHKEQSFLKFRKNLSWKLLFHLISDLVFVVGYLPLGFDALTNSSTKQEKQVVQFGCDIPMITELGQLLHVQLLWFDKYFIYQNSV